MFIFSYLFPGFMLGKSFQQYVTTKFAKLRYFLSQNIGGTKDIMSPLKLGPWLRQQRA